MHARTAHPLGRGMCVRLHLMACTACTARADDVLCGAADGTDQVEKTIAVYSAPASLGVCWGFFAFRANQFAKICPRPVPGRQTMAAGVGKLNGQNSNQYRVFGSIAHANRHQDTRADHEAAESAICCPRGSCRSPVGSWLGQAEAIA